MEDPLNPTLDRLEAQLQHAPDGGERLAALQGLAEALGKTEPRRALGLAEEARALARRLGDARRAAQSQQVMGESLYRLGSYAEAQTLLEDLLEQALTEGLPQISAAAYVLLGHIDRSQGEARKALQHYNSALELLQPGGDAAQKIAALNGLAATYYGLHDHSSAAELYLQSLELAQARADREAEGQALSNLATLYLEQGEHARALELFQQALKLCAHNSLREAVVRNNLGFTYYRLGEYDRSVVYNQEAHRLATRLGNPRVEASALGNLGLSYAAMGQTARALEFSEQALRLEQGLNNRPTQADLLVQIGRIWLGQGDLEAAEAHLTQALDIAAECAHRKGLTEAHLHLVEICTRKGQPERALAHHRAHHELTVTGLKEQLERKTMALLVRFQAEQAMQQAEIVRLRNVELVKANQALHRANQEKEHLLTQLQTQQGELERMVRTDGLTGLYNRRYLEQELGLVFAQSRLRGQTLSVALIDLDHFKAVNDTYSHQAGDEVLKIAAKIFRQTLPGFDLVARYGGEEFAAVFPGLGATQAAEHCERLRSAIERHDWSPIHPDLAITVSVGVSDAPDSAHHDKLLMAADQQLYQAKRLRRNRVCFG